MLESPFSTKQEAIGARSTGAHGSPLANPSRIVDISSSPSTCWRMLLLYFELFCTPQFACSSDFRDWVAKGGSRTPEPPNFPVPGVGSAFLCCNNPMATVNCGSPCTVVPFCPHMGTQSSKVFLSLVNCVVCSTHPTRPSH